MIQLLTRIEGLGVVSMHKEERIKVLGMKIQLLEGQADEGFKVGGGRESVEGEKGTSIEKVCHSSREGQEDEVEAT